VKEPQHKIDGGSGVGTESGMRGVNGEGQLGAVVSNKKGVSILRQE
jgi:hypothetical protein